MFKGFLIPFWMVCISTLGAQSFEPVEILNEGKPLSPWNSTFQPWSPDVNEIYFFGIEKNKLLIHKSSDQGQHFQGIEGSTILGNLGDKQLQYQFIQQMSDTIFLFVKTASGLSNHLMVYKLNLNKSNLSIRMNDIPIEYEDTFYVRSVGKKLFLIIKNTLNIIIKEIDSEKFSISNFSTINKGIPISEISLTDDFEASGNPFTWIEFTTISPSGLGTFFSYKLTMSNMEYENSLNVTGFLKSFRIKQNSTSRVLVVGSKNLYWNSNYTQSQVFNNFSIPNEILSVSHVVRGDKYLIHCTPKDGGDLIYNIQDYTEPLEITFNKSMNWNQFFPLEKNTVKGLFFIIDRQNFGFMPWSKISNSNSNLLSSIYLLSQPKQNYNHVVHIEGQNTIIQGNEIGSGTTLLKGEIGKSDLQTFSFPDRKTPIVVFDYLITFETPLPRITPIKRYSRQSTLVFVTEQGLLAVKIK